MYVTPQDLIEATGKVRYSAQAKALDELYPGIRFTRRGDGSIALRQEELDRHTLSQPSRAKVKRNWRPDLSVLDKVG